MGEWEFLFVVIAGVSVFVAHNVGDVGNIKNRHDVLLLAFITVFIYFFTFGGKSACNLLNCSHFYNISLD